MPNKTPLPPPAPKAPFVDYSGHYTENLNMPRSDTGSYRAQPTVLYDAGILLVCVGISVVIDFIGSTIGMLIWHWVTP